jgi:hypothetical protein
LDAELVHDGQVAGDLFCLVQVEGAVELLEVHHIGQVLLGEPQDGERPACRRVGAGIERDDLHGDVRERGELEQVLQLPAHHLRPVGGPAQRGLVDDRP